MSKPKFVKVEIDGKQQWAVEYTCSNTGSKCPEVGDILKTTRGHVSVTKILSVQGTGEKYGDKVVFEFANR